MRKLLNKVVALSITFFLIFEQSGFAQVALQIQLPAYINGYVAADRFRPVQLRSLSFDPGKQNFNLFLDKGDQIRIDPGQITRDAKLLMEYFRIGLALPNDSFWVNLRPDGADQIIDSFLEKTDIGQVMLASDLQLKKDLANFTSPNTEEGRLYWDKLYAKANALLGEQEISIPTLTRPWIVPGEVIVRETDSTCHILKASLKVCLEQDYIKDSKAYNFTDPRLKELNDFSSQLIREFILPKLAREVNSSKKYAPLRQVYYSLILAQWFKEKNRGGQGEYAKKIDGFDLNGLTSAKRWNKDRYFNDYKRSFKKGEYNLSENRYTSQGSTIRQYFSGGMKLANALPPVTPGLPGTQDGGGLRIRGDVASLDPANELVQVTDDGAIITGREDPSVGEAKRDGGEQASVQTENAFLTPVISLWKRIYNPGQVKKYEKILKDHNELRTERQRAAEMLGKLGDPRSAGPLAEYLVQEELGSDYDMISPVVENSLKQTGKTDRDIETMLLAAYADLKISPLIRLNALKLLGDKYGSVTSQEMILSLNASWKKLISSGEIKEPLPETMKRAMNEEFPKIYQRAQREQALQEKGSSGNKKDGGLTAEKFTVEIDYIMNMLKITDYPRIAETFKRSTDPVAFVNGLAKVSGKSKEDILAILDRSDLFKSLSANYRVRSAKSFDPVEFPVIRNRIEVNADSYAVYSTIGDKSGLPISDYLSLMREESRAVPFVFRDEMEQFVGRFLGQKISNYKPKDLQDLVEISEGFIKNVDLAKIKYVVTSGIGANEMYSHQLAQLLNAYFKANNIEMQWIVVNNPAHLNKIPEAANNENTIVFEMSRSGTTKETVDFFNATSNRFKTRIVAANSGPLKEAALALAKTGKILIIDDTPGDIGGRQMNRKTLMTYIPLFVALSAGTKDTRESKRLLSQYVNAMFEANRELAYSNGLKSAGINLAEFLFRHRASGRNKFSVVADDSLKFTAKELFQLLNEGANKKISGGTNNNILDSYSLQADSNRYNIVFDKAADSQLPIFLLDSRSKDYISALAYIEKLKDKGIPVIVITVKQTDDINENLRAVARTSALLQDMVVYFTYITNQDANSNPAVKMVREITAAMFDILKQKKADRAAEINIDFSDVMRKMDLKQETDKKNSAQAISDKKIQRKSNSAEFASLGQAIKDLAKQLGISDENVIQTQLGSISSDVVKADVGEAGGNKVADIDEAFSRSSLNKLGELSAQKVPPKLDQQEVLENTRGFKVSAAKNEADQINLSGPLSQKLADYFYAMYQQRKKDMQYLSLTYMEADLNNPTIKEIANDITAKFSDLNITTPLLALPGVAHTGIEAIMSHPENVFNIAILYTNTYGKGLGTQEIEKGVTVDDATYVYGISNVIRMGLAGIPNIIFEVENNSRLNEVQQAVKEGMAIFRNKIAEGEAIMEVYDNKVNKLLKAALKDKNAYEQLKQSALTDKKELISYFERQLGSALISLPEDLFGKGFGYDVRGNALAVKAGDIIDLTPENCYIIGKTLGTYNVQPGKKALITGDQRWHTPILRLALALGFNSVGVDVEFSDEIFGTGEHGLLSGENTNNYAIMIQISGSHNIPEKNGLKIKYDVGGNLEPLYAKELADVYVNAKKGDFRQSENQGGLTEISGLLDQVVAAYDETLPKIDPAQPVVFDCRNSALIPALKRIVELRGLKDVTWINDLVDPAMSGGIWDPSKREALEPAMAKVKEVNKKLAEKGSPYRAIGFVFDGDGDRAAAIREDGVDVPAFEMTLPFYQRFISDPANRRVVEKLRAAGSEKIQLACDIRATSSLLKLIENYSRDYEGYYIQPGYPAQRDFVSWRIGLLKEFVDSKPDLSNDEKFMKNFEHFLGTYFTAEASGHQFFHICPTYPQKVIDAGIAVAFNLLKIKETIGENEAQDPKVKRLQNTLNGRSSLADLINSFLLSISSEDIRIVVPNSIKATLENLMADKLKEKYKGQLLDKDEPVKIQGNMRIQPKDNGAITVEGVRVQFKDGKSSSLFRKSNTAEQATLMFEGVDAQTLIRLMKEMKVVILETLNELKSQGADIAKACDKVDLSELDQKTQRAEQKYSVKKDGGDIEAAVAAITMGKSSVPDLVEALSNPNYRVRLGAERELQRLGELTQEDKIVRLVSDLTDPDSKIRQAAAVDLEALGELTPERQVARYVEDLSDNDREVRRAAVGGLVRLNKLNDQLRMIYHIANLSDPDSKIRLAAVLALGNMGDPQAVDALVRVLKDREGDVRSATAIALGKINSQQAIEPLVKALGDPLKSVRDYAFLSLVKLNKARVIELFGKVLSTSPERDVRMAAVTALANLGDKRAIEPLHWALANFDVQDRYEVALALQKLTSGGKDGGVLEQKALIAQPINSYAQAQIAGELLKNASLQADRYELNGYTKVEKDFFDSIKGNLVVANFRKMGKYVFYKEGWNKNKPVLRVSNDFSSNKNPEASFSVYYDNSWKVYAVDATSIMLDCPFGQFRIFRRSKTRVGVEQWNGVVIPEAAMAQEAVTADGGAANDKVVYKIPGSFVSLENKDADTFMLTYDEGIQGMQSLKVVLISKHDLSVKQELSLAGFSDLFDMAEFSGRSRMIIKGRGSKNPVAIWLDNNEIKARELINGPADLPQDGGDKKQAPLDTGGIDFRAVPIVSAISPVAAPGASAVMMPKVSLKELDSQWKEIQHAAQNAELPYAKMKRFVSCCNTQDEAAGLKQEVTAYVVNLLKLEEERAIATPKELKEIVALVIA